MNEKRMKTLGNLGEPSSPPAQAAGWSVKVRAQAGGGSEKPAIDVENGLEPPMDERIIAETTGKIKFEP